MSFFKRTQEELDAALLKAAGQYKFDKMKRLLAKGANILARDADGNTVLHKMAMSDPNSGDCHREFLGPNHRLADEFVCYLLGRGVDVNAANRAGKTCLHYAASNDNDFDARLIAIFLNRGANPNAADQNGKTPLHYVVPDRSALRLIENGAKVAAQDKDGRTPLHAAAAKGDEGLVHQYLKSDKSVIAIRDKDGKYAHDSAVAGLAGHHMLSRMLQANLQDYQKEQQRLQRKKEQERRAAEAPDDSWVLLQPDQVAHVKIEKAIGYKLTEIFNFHARTYTVITQNLETKAEMTVVKGFDDFADKTLLKDSYQALIQLGGKADEGVIHRQPLNKGLPKIPRPGAGDS